jgi:hypothetical protein
LHTQTFIERVCDTAGYITLASKFPTGVGHVGLPREKIAQAALRLDSRGQDFYCAFASQRVKNTRNQDNALGAKALWIDLDVGEGKKGPHYLTRREAIEAVFALADAIGQGDLLTVLSGHGIHAYFPLTRLVDRQEWEELAHLVRDLCDALKLKVDHTCTCDIARLMRLPGTHNRKDPTRPVRVRVISWGSVFDPDALRDALQAALDALDYVRPTGRPDTFQLPPGGPARPMSAEGNDALGVKTYAPSSAHRIADQCPVIGDMRDSLGRDQSQPVWYHALQLLSHTIEAMEVGHEWSSGHPGYDHDATEKALARAHEHGPTLCTTFQKAGCVQCLSCQWLGKVTSPIALGVEVAPKPDTSGRPDFPRGWSWVAEKQGLYFQGEPEEDDDGNLVQPQARRVCGSCFYPIERRREGDSFAVLLAIETPGGETRRLSVPGSLIGEGGSKLHAHLGSQEVVMSRKGDMDAYLKAWVEKLRHTNQVVETHNTFGWTDDGTGFVVGDELYTPAGVIQAPLRAPAVAHESALKAHGDLDVWKHVVDTAYNHEGCEAYQFMVMLGFASPLYSMMDLDGGITVHAHSPESGIGKSSAQQAALAAWGAPQLQQMNHTKVTEKALIDILSGMHNLPVMVDEITNMEGSRASQLVFSMSDGQGYRRLSAAAVQRELPRPWSTILMTNGNALVSEQIANHRAQHEAELMRLFEVRLEATGILTPNQALDLFGLLRTNHGHAGREFIRYVVANKPKIQQDLMAILKHLNTLLSFRQAERYWSRLAACVLAALAICRRLDLVAFDAQSMLAWISEEVTSARGDVIEASLPPEELFGMMMSNLHSGVLVTDIEGDCRRLDTLATVQGNFKMWGPLHGRVILDTSWRMPLTNQPAPRRLSSPKMTLNRPTLYLSTNSVRAWCAAHGASPNEIFRLLVETGAANDRPRPFSLSKGVSEYIAASPQQRCWVIFLDQLDPAVSNRWALASPIGVEASA